MFLAQSRYLSGIISPPSAVKGTSSVLTPTAGRLFTVCIRKLEGPRGPQQNRSLAVVSKSLFGGRRKTGVDACVSPSVVRNLGWGWQRKPARANWLAVCSIKLSETLAPSDLGRSRIQTSPRLQRKKKKKKKKKGSVALLCSRPAKIVALAEIGPKMGVIGVVLLADPGHGHDCHLPMAGRIWESALFYSHLQKQSAETGACAENDCTQLEPQQTP